MTRCPRCTGERVLHLWRTDMARLTLIDEWKCLDAVCGHRWDTATTSAQLAARSAERSGADRARWTAPGPG